MKEHNQSNSEELTKEEERLRRVWKRTIEEIRKINEVYSNPQYGLIETKTLAGKAYYNALLQYAHTTKFARLPEIYDTELYEVCAPFYRYGGKRIEKNFYFLLMRKFCSAFQDKDSYKSKELARIDERARLVVYKRYFEEKAYTTIENELQISNSQLRRLCKIAIDVMNSRS